MISLYCSSVTSKSKRGHVEDMTQNRSRHDRWQQQHTSTAVLFISSSNKVLWATLALCLAALTEWRQRTHVIIFNWIEISLCGGDRMRRRYREACLFCKMILHSTASHGEILTILSFPSFNNCITMQPLALGYSVSPLSVVPQKRANKHVLQIQISTKELYHIQIIAG